jgi:hypothetical protein
MWVCFFGGYTVFIAALIGYATHVALSGRDKQRRADAYKVLRLLWGAVTGAGGVAAVALKLHQVGLM